YIIYFYFFPTRRSSDLPILSINLFLKITIFFFQQILILNPQRNSMVMLGVILYMCEKKDLNGFMDLRHSRVLMVLYYGVPIKTIALDCGYGTVQLVFI